MKKNNYKIYLFRHGETYCNKKGIFTGRKESKLTSKGKKDAQKISQKLKNKKFKAAFQTKLSRSKNTLKIVLKNHPETKIIKEDNRIIERSYGILEGKKHETFIEEMGKKDIKFLKEKGDALGELDPKFKKKLETMMGKAEYKVIHRSWNIPPKDGESFKMVEKRVKKFIKDLKKFIKKNKCNVAISAHGNSIRLFRKIMEKAKKSEAIKWNIPYDEYFEYKIKV